MLIVEDVVDTGLTLNYLCETFRLRSRRSLAAVTLPRPAVPPPGRRPPVRYVGFTVPDEFFVGYGFDIEERYRNLPICTSCATPRDTQRVDAGWPLTRTSNGGAARSSGRSSRRSR